MLFDNRILKRWSDVLPLVQRIMMAEPNEVIGVFPAQLLFGKPIQLDRGINLPNLPREGVEAEVAQRVLLDTAQLLQQQKDASHMEATTGVTTRFDVGSYVLISYNPRKMNAKPPTKLHPRLKGPYWLMYKVTSKYSSCHHNLVTDEIEDYHVTRLRKFR